MKKSKVILTVISLVLVVAMSVAGTLAFLKVKTTDVQNTFSPSNIALSLTEEKDDLKMIPGVDMKKAPKVTVTADIDTYVFVKVEASANAAEYLTWAVDESATSWIKVPGETNVYYREVSADVAADGESFYVLTGKGTGDFANGFVTTKTSVTEAMMNTAESSKPTLTFTAYAVQKDAMADVNAAWTEAKAQA